MLRKGQLWTKTGPNVQNLGSGNQKVTQNGLKSQSKIAEMMCASSWTQRAPLEGPKRTQYVNSYVDLTGYKGQLWLSRGLIWRVFYYKIFIIIQF